MPDAIRDFDRVLTLDSRYALAYVGLAEVRFWLYEVSRARNKPDSDELRLAIARERRGGRACHAARERSSGIRGLDLAH